MIQQANDATLPTPVRQELCNREDDDLDGLVDEAPDNQRIAAQPMEHCLNAQALIPCAQKFPLARLNLFVHR